MKKYNEKFNKIKIPMLFFAVFYAILLTLGSTLSWMVSSDNVANEFKTKEIGFHVTLIDEFTTIPTSLEGGMYPKRVTVKNTGSVKAFVRVLALPAIVSTTGEPLPARFGTEVNADFDTQYWMDGGDNYYYYLEVLDPDETAPDLFTRLGITMGVPNRYKDATLAIHVKSESIFITPDSYRDAWWQGDIPTDSPLKDIDAILQSKAT